VALKVMHRIFAAAPKMVERFNREVQAAMRVRHANVVEILGYGALPDGRPWFAMELVEGENLETHLARRGRLDAREALAVLEPVCAALGAAHEAGLVHRDLKAANVLIGAKGIKLVDFGVAKMVAPEQRGGPALTTVGRQIGTPVAMAPEQLRGEDVDARTDVYGLGVLTFYLLTRRYPFEHDDPVELELAHIETPAPRPSRFASVPRAVDTVAMRCLEKRPERRYPSAAAFIEELRRAVDPSRAAAPAGGARAVAIYVEARLPAEVDDWLAEQVADLHDLAVTRLGHAGLRPALATGTAVLAAAPLDSDDRRAHATALAVELFGLLRDRGDARLGWVVCVHADGAELAADGCVVGGPILRIAGWAPPASANGALTTRECAGLPLTAASGERYVRLPLKIAGKGPMGDSYQ
jgi:serine/threonine-protein kinase